MYINKIDVDCGQDNQQAIWYSVYCIASNHVLDNITGKGGQAQLRQVQLPKGSLQQYEIFTDRPNQGLNNQILFGSYSSRLKNLVQDSRIIFNKQISHLEKLA